MDASQITLGKPSGSASTHRNHGAWVFNNNKGIWEYVASIQTQRTHLNAGHRIAL